MTAVSERQQLAYIAGQAADMRLNVELVPEDALIEWSNRGREGKPKRILDQRYEKK